jgi:hypothetical protein
MESDRRSSEAAAIGQRETCMSAMEVELRALRAKPDTAPGDPSDVLKAGRLSGARPSA